MTLRIAPLLLVVIFAVGCSFPGVLSPYKLDIPQGNNITADQVARLKIGMTRPQVRFILGTPLLTDPFHANRWDYVFTDARNGKIITEKVFTVLFENEKLVKFTGETLPARPTPASTASAIPAL